MKLKSFIILFVLVMVSCLSVNTVYAFEKNVDEKLMGPVSRSYILREKYPNRTSYFLEESFISRNYLSSNNKSIKNPLLEILEIVCSGRGSLYNNKLQNKGTPVWSSNKLPS